MPNVQNLKPGSHRLTLEEQSAGGKASVIARRERKKIRETLEEYLDRPAKDMPMFDEIAKKIGFSSDTCIKDVFTAICLINSAAEADLTQLERLSKILEEMKVGIDVNVTPFEGL